LCFGIAGAYNTEQTCSVPYLKAVIPMTPQQASDTASDTTSHTTSDTSRQTSTASRTSPYWGVLAICAIAQFMVVLDGMLLS
jgi:hypothetical protein